MCGVLAMVSGEWSGVVWYRSMPLAEKNFPVNPPSLGFSAAQSAGLFRPERKTCDPSQFKLSCNFASLRHQQAAKQVLMFSM